ncbi:GNAT family N-acetyltransferase [Cryptosporangium minutisporangium]|uniref:GNAT family N-acetyltransferase n=1 Tax=Cryptosporangium minutisporangium TaxID=113569 RepID=A0ABP6T876_9ACTN
MIDILPVAAADAGELLTLQRAAYVTEARLYGDPNLPPLVQTLAELESELAGSLALKAVAGHRIVGAVRARVEDGTVHVGRLTVAPDQQGRGVGSRLLDAIEQASGVAAAALFTGHLSEGNLRLYIRHGYVETHRTALRPGVDLVHLRKDLGAWTSS